MVDTQSHSVPVKTAVSNAMDFVFDLYADERIEDILVEEVEFSELANQWLITIGFTITKVKDNSSSLILPKEKSLVNTRLFI